MGYENGKIYKVICSETGDVYVGSTKQTLNDRLGIHKAPSNNCMSKTFINPIIVLIKDFPCNNKKELEAEERIFIKEGNCVNKNIPGRTPKEYYEDNVDKIKEYNKEWIEDNKDKIKKHKANYRKKNSIKIKEYKSEKIECKCGKIFSRSSGVKHFKSDSHQSFMMYEFVESLL